MQSLWQRWIRPAAAWLAIGFAGCASGPPPLRLDLAQTVVVPAEIEPDVQLEEAGWKGRSAVTGGLIGGGAGLAVGGLVCAGTGFLAPLCLTTVLPLTTAAGLVGGGIAGAKLRDASGDRPKRTLLQTEWRALAARAPLHEAVRRLLEPGADRATDPMPGPSRPSGAWRVQVGYAVLGTVGSGADQPFALQATAQVVVRGPQGERPVAERVYMEPSIERLTLAQWRDDDARALRQALDRAAARLAERVAHDLSQARP